jgi:integrase/recombinase XerD
MHGCIADKRYQQAERKFKAVFSYRRHRSFPLRAVAAITLTSQDTGSGWGGTMPRRKRPPAGKATATTQFRDPAAWLPGFVAYLEAECGMSPNTVSAYRRDCTKFLDWNRDHDKSTVHQIGVDTLAEWLGRMTEQNYAPSSMARCLVSIRMFFRYLLLEGVIAQTTVDLINSPKMWQRLPRVLSPEMVDELLEAPRAQLDRYYRRDKAILAVMYATGCRVSEVAGLQSTHLNLKDAHCRCTGKGNKERLVSLNPRAIDAIQEYLQHERPHLEANASGTPEHLFLTRSGRPLNRESIWSMIQRYAARVGCGPEVGPHTLRHSFATHMLAGGAEIRALQEMLGHASIRTTQIYTHVDHSRLKAVHKTCHPRG